MDAALRSQTAAQEADHWWFRGRRSILAAVAAEVIRPSRDVTVVDVGCGTGGNTAYLAERYRAIGIDPSPHSIALARQRFPKVSFIEGIAPDDLGDETKHAALYLIADVLEHVKDDALFISRLIEAAKPGAYFLIAVPADMALWSRHDEVHGHYRRYDPQGLANLWRDLPVTCRMLSYFNARLRPAVVIIRGLKRRGWGSSGTSSDLKLQHPVLNSFLERVLAGEAHHLVQALRDGRKTVFRRGVSLIALVQRDIATYPVLQQAQRPMVGAVEGRHYDG